MIVAMVVAEESTTSPGRPLLNSASDYLRWKWLVKQLNKKTHLGAASSINLRLLVYGHLSSEPRLARFTADWFFNLNQ